MRKMAVIFDMDGTLCDVRGIRHYVESKRKNFHHFHRASLFCPPRKDVLEYWHRALPYYRIVVTARDQRYDDTTKMWLAKHGLEPDAYYSRQWGDTNPDHIVKSEILQRIYDDGYEPVLAIDDREDIAEVWRAAGIRCWVVGEVRQDV